MQFVPLERRRVSLNLEVHCFPRCTVGIRLFSSVGGVFSWLIQSMGLEPRLWELVDFLCKWRTTYLCFPKPCNVIPGLCYQNLVLHDYLTLLCILHFRRMPQLCYWSHQCWLWYFLKLQPGEMLGKLTKVLKRLPSSQGLSDTRASACQRDHLKDPILMMYTEMK